MPAVADIRIDPVDFAEGEAAFGAAMDALRNGTLQIPPPMLPSVWIPANISLSKQESSRPGPMRLTGYQRPLADALVEPEIDEIAVLKGVQVGYSRTLAACLCYGISYLALKCILAQPTDDDAKGFYKDTLEPRFRDVEAMRRVIRTPARGEAQDTWDEHRYANGGVLYMRGAASDDAFRRISSRWNFGDEVDADAWRGANADSQGEKLDLFRDRGTDFWDSKLVLGSTPLMRDTSLVWKSYATSDKRQLHVRCPHCDRQQVLRWGSPKTPFGFRWTTDDRGNVEDCWYQCESGCRIDEHHKGAMVEAGEMIATAIPDRPGHVGFHWPSWYSEAPKAAWTVIAQRWLSAQGDPEKLRVFVNNWMAEPWDDLAANGFDATAIHDMATPYPAEVPDDVVILTAGVDVQSNKEGGDFATIASREVTVIGWDRHEMPRVVGHWVIEGDPGSPDADARLDAVIQRGFRKRDGSIHYVRMTAIDLGGHHGDATKLYAAARRKWNVWAVKGKNARLGSRSASVWPRKISRDRQKGVEWVMIDTQLAKDAVGRKLKIKGAGGPTFPASLPARYFEELTAEKLVTDKRGNRYWTRKSKKNTGEAWDCLVYAYAALKGAQASFPAWADLNLAADKAGISRDPPHDPTTGEIHDAYDGPDRSAQAPEPEDAPVAPPPPPPPAAAPRRTGFRVVGRPTRGGW